MLDIINSEMPREFEDVAWDSNYPGRQGMDGIPRLAEWLRGEIDNGFLVYGGNIDSLFDQNDLLTTMQSRAPVLATRFQVPASTDPADYPDNSSEYLYRILQATDYDGTPAIDFLRGNSIDDTDGDGFLEIVDAWGNPLVFGFQVFDDDGNYVAGDLEISLVLDSANNAGGVADNGGLNPGRPGNITNVPDLHNLQIRLLSTGGLRVNDENDLNDLGGVEIISN